MFANPYRIRDRSKGSSPYSLPYSLSRPRFLPHPYTLAYTPSGFPALWLSGFPAFWLSGFPAFWLSGFPAFWLSGFPAFWLSGFLSPAPLLPFRPRFLPHSLTRLPAFRLSGSLALWLSGFLSPAPFPPFSSSRYFPEKARYNPT
jgi:hypothetical protein